MTTSTTKSIPFSDESQCFDKEAEGLLIASLIREPQRLGEVNLSPGDFYIDDYHYLFEAIIVLWQRGDKINETTIKREADAIVALYRREDKAKRKVIDRREVGPWVIGQIIADLPDSFDTLHYAGSIREASRRRQARNILSDTLKGIVDPKIDVQELLDGVRLKLDLFDGAGAGASSRVVRFSDIKISGTQPPTYKMTCMATNGRMAVVTFSSIDLSEAAFKRRIREHLAINPLLPAPEKYPAFIHTLLQQAVIEDPLDDENPICVLLREWLASAVEAEEVEDLAQGYVLRDECRWFKKDRFFSLYHKKTGKQLSTTEYWSAVHDCGGRRSKVISMNGRKERLWGIEEGFFAEPSEKQLSLPGEKSANEQADDS